LSAITGIDEKINMSSRTIRFGIVVPACDEQDNIASLYDELARVLASSGMEWEILFVDDGSTDGTWAVIESLHQRDERVKGIRLSRNFGHQYALLAGLRHVKGDAVISMDADLQHPPILIPALIDEWRKGNKIVNTIRLEPADVSVFKKLSSRLFYRVFSYLSGVRLEYGMADYRLLDRQVLADILDFREEGLFLRGIVQWVGYRSACLTYTCANRHSGETKYTFRKMIRLAWNGISSFSIVPLRIGVVIGFCASGIAFIGVLYAILGELFWQGTVPGWASSLAIISFLFSILFVLLGLLGEYLGRVLVEVRRRPRYLIAESTGIDESDAGSDTPGFTERTKPV
jgi:dolichol-phosphate mannosyltransferase